MYVEQKGQQDHITARNRRWTGLTLEQARSIAHTMLINSGDAERIEHDRPDLLSDSGYNLSHVEELHVELNGDYYLTIGRE